MPLFETRSATIHVPDLLYHGTCGSRLVRILAEGLRPDLGKESGLSQDAVYLSTDPGMAAAVARRRAARHGGVPVVLGIDAALLDGHCVMLDINLSAGRHCSASLAYGGRIEPAHLRVVPWSDVEGLEPWPVGEEFGPGAPPFAFDLEWERAHEFAGCGAIPR